MTSFDDKINKNINNLTKSERKVLRVMFLFYKINKKYSTEKEIRKKLGYKSDVYNLLNKLVDKDLLSIWDSAGKNGSNLYHFPDISSSKSKEKFISKIIKAINTNR